MNREFLFGIAGEYIYQNNGNKKILVTIGDSWTAGEGAIGPKWVTKKIDRWQLKAAEFNYQHYLMNRMPGYDLLNLGTPGNSNSAALLSLKQNLDLLKSYDEVIVILGITCGLRDYRVLNSARRPIGMVYMGGVDYLSEDENNYMMSALLIINDRATSVRVFDEVYNFQNICKVNNFKYCMFNAFTTELTSPDAEETLQDFKFLKNLIDYDSLVNFNEYTNSACSYLSKQGKLDRKNYLAKCEHPNSLGYKLMADKIYNHLKTQGQIDG